MQSAMKCLGESTAVHAVRAAALLDMRLQLDNLQADEYLPIPPMHSPHTESLLVGRVAANLVEATRLLTWRMRGV